MNLLRRHWLSVAALTAVFQTVIILYNHSTGLYSVDSPWEFLVRLAFGVLFSFPAAATVVVIDEVIVRTLDRRLPWERGFAARAAAEGLAAAASGAVLGGTLTLAVHRIAPYAEGAAPNAVKNALIAAVLNLIVTATVEAVTSFHRSRDARERAERLEREMARVRFETLKTQLNPHFMFNSLNVLSTLVRKDAAKAEEFIRAFAGVYRYTLEVIDEPVVPLARELEFVRSYLYLLQIRFTGALEVRIDADEEALGLFVPPLSVQTLLENAVKHNTASAEAPLTVIIAAGRAGVTVRNPLRPRPAAGGSTGVGLANLRTRYELLGGPAPSFTQTEHEFVSHLPLIVPE